MPHTYDYPRAALSADSLVFSRDAAPTDAAPADGVPTSRVPTGEWYVLLILRDHPPFEGYWAFPGGFMDVHETIEEAAHRELEEETGLRGVPLEQMHVFSGIDRDPRTRLVTVAFWAVVPDRDPALLRAGDDARDVRWFPLSALPPLPPPHEEMLAKARERALTPREGVV